MQGQRDSKLISAPAFEEVELDCQNHGKSKAKIIFFNGAKIGPTCAVCEAEKIAEEKRAFDEKEATEAAVRRQRSIEFALQAAMIPPRFQSHSFETFIVKTPDQAKRKQRCQEYAEKFPEFARRGMSLVFCGTTGTGKTHLACAIANFIIKEHAKTAIFLSVMDAVRRVKETYRKGSEETERDSIRWFSQPDLLILDEVGVQFGSDAEKMILFEIINKRYESMKPTILLSNLSSENMKEFAGERVMDRMKEGGGAVLTFDWPSFRNSNNKK